MFRKPVGKPFLQGNLGSPLKSPAQQADDTAFRITADGDKRATSDGDRRIRQ